ncbi:hypothetical protein Tco_0184573 [Tanacetum coccineum]
MAAFNVLETHFQMFIKSRIYLDDEYVVMTRNYFLQYTQLEISEFCDTLIQHMESVKKSIDKRALHKKEYDSWVNERQMQTTEEKVDTSKALDASLVDTESSRTELKEQDTSSRSGNDAHADDANIRHIYDEEPMAEPRFASQADVHNELSKPLTTHYLPKGKESACEKPHHVIAPGSSRYSSNDMVHNHYLEEAKKKTQESSRNSEPSVTSSARLQSTANEVNSRAKVPSNKTTNRNKPVEQTSFAKKPERHIPKGHMFSIKKTSIVHEKTMTPRSCLKWKPTGKIFKTVGLRWIPTGKIFTSSTTKVDSEPPNGSNKDITNPYKCEQTLNVIAGSNTLSWKPSQGGSSKLNLPDHRYKRRCCSLIPVESDSLPHAHAHAVKTYYWHQDSRIKKAQELKTKTFANSDIKDYSSETKHQGRLLESFQEYVKYEHVGQDTRSQRGKDDQYKQGKDLEISKSKTKSKDNDKGSRSKITQHKGTSLQQNKDQRFKNSTTKQSQ